jgi:pimeloyl-ACP methyl ester carboxylesterase
LPHSQKTRLNYLHSLLVESALRMRQAYKDYMTQFKRRLVAIVLAAFLFACNDDMTSGSTPAGKYFVSAEETASISLAALRSFALIADEKEFLKLLRYGVTRYTIHYRTTFKGKSIEASGVLYLPDGSAEAAPLISLQHGTEFLKANAPSVSTEATGMEYFASAGYIAFMPDFIGYGVSDDIFHPYYDQTSSALCVVDMIKAVKEYLVANQIAFSDKLFLAGYSEGGYVTLAAAKEIDNHAEHGLEVTAVAAGAGGYELSDMLTSIAGGSYYAYPSYLAFVLMSYNYTYDWNKPASYFFNTPYAAAVDTYLNGQYSGNFINGKLTTDVASLLNPVFYDQLQLADGEGQLKLALADNSIDGWKTDLPVRLYHGTSDEIIPFSNSELTLESFKTADATAISLTPISGGTHGSSFLPMLRDFVPWFEAMR